MPDVGFQHGALARDLGRGVRVKDGRLERVAHAAHVDAAKPVSGLGHSPGVDQPDPLRAARLRLNRAHDVGNPVGVDCLGLLRVIVGLRRDERHGVEHPVRAADRLLHVFVAGGIAPDDPEPLALHDAGARDRSGARQLLIGGEKALVLLGGAHQQDNVVPFPALPQLVEGGQPHRPRRTKEHHGFFHRAPPVPSSGQVTMDPEGLQALRPAPVVQDPRRPS